MTDRRPLVLLLHGVCSTGPTLEPLASAFRDRGVTVAAPTLAARQRTDAGVRNGNAARVTLSALLEDARQEARALAARHGVPPVIVGHSNGALLALALADEASGLGLVAPAPPPSVPGVPLWVRQALFARIFGSGWTTRAILFRPSWPFLGETPPAALEDTLCPDSGPAMAEVLAAERGGPFDPAPPLPCPAIVVAGARDALVPPGLTRKLATRFAAPHRTIPDARHWAAADPRHAGAIRNALLPLLTKTETAT